MSLALMGLITTAAAEDVTTRTLPVDMPLLTIQGGNADVIIQHTPGAASSTVTVTPTTWWEGCELAFSGTRSEAFLSLQEDGEPAGRGCAAQIELTLAGSTDITVATVRGGVEVDGMPGDLTVEMGSGRVTGSLSGAATIALDRGRVVLHDLSAPVDAAVRFGSIDLTYSEAIAGTVAANVNIGRITTRFPYGTWLNASVDPGLGRIVRTIPSKAAAATQLDATARVGNIRVEAVIEEEPETSVALND